MAVRNFHTMRSCKRTRSYSSPYYRTNCHRVTDWDKLYDRVNTLNNIDKCAMYKDEKTALMDRYPGIVDTDIEGLTVEDLKSINIGLKYIKAIYTDSNKYGYLYDHERLAPSMKIEMTATERIDARTRLSNLMERFPKLDKYFYCIMQLLRLLD